MNYGDKRDYKKIDILWYGKYECSTTWFKTCKEAKQAWIKEQGNIKPSDCLVGVTARFSK